LNEPLSVLDIIEKIDSQLATGEVGRMFAVIHVAGKQRKITTDDIVVLDKHIAADIGERIRFNKASWSPIFVVYSVLILSTRRKTVIAFSCS